MVTELEGATVQQQPRSANVRLRCEIVVEYGSAEGFAQLTTLHLLYRTLVVHMATPTSLLAFLQYSSEKSRNRQPSER